MNVLVIGAAGFLGSHLVERLITDGHSVDAIDDLSTGTLANLADARAMGGDLRIHTLDAATNELGALVRHRRPQVIVHLGVLPPGRDTPRDFGCAVHSTTAVLESAAIIGQCKVVLTAAADSFYGNLAPRDVPVKEGYAGPPGGVRGLLSRQLVEMCQLYREAHAVEFSALVLGEVYGPRQRADGGLVAQLRAAQAAGEAARLPGDDRYTRDFVFVDDAVDALARSLAKADGLVVNIGTGVATPVRELWAMLGGHHTELLPDSEQLILRNALAATRARIQLGWSAWTTLAEGVLALR